MHEDSPPPFIVIRTPRAISENRPTPYQQALDVVAIVHEIVQQASARFYLKDRLDRAATNLVFALGRAADVPIGKWRDYRTAQRHANDVATLLDILEHQRAAVPQLLEKAQRTVRDLLAAISPLANG